ncbi:MAG: methyltransferase domain-containing protein [Legionella sp.]|nr:methyltransferase domain-containing protein [Legionella sp.]
MLINQQIKKFGVLNQWFRTPLGLSVAQEFKHILKALPTPLKGDTLLQLGNCGNNLWLAPLAFNHKWIASPFRIHHPNQIECSLNQLPLVRNSIDCVLAPLTLEPFNDSFSLLDEIDRILKPMGHVVFISINPWSLWGAAMKCGFIHCYDQNKIKMRTPYYLNRIFLQRGYKQCSLIPFSYIPPINNQKFIDTLSFLNEIGKMLWPLPSGLYCYIAQKYEYIQPSFICDPKLKPRPGDYIAPLHPAIGKVKHP